MAKTETTPQSSVQKLKPDLDAGLYAYALNLTSALTLIPFLLIVGVLAVAYTVFLLVAAGPKFLLVSFIVYAPATLLFVKARREQDRRLFSGPELVI